MSEMLAQLPSPPRRADAASPVPPRTSGARARSRARSRRRPAAQVAAPPAAAEPPRARIAIDETLAAPAALLTGRRPAGSVPLAARLSVTLDALRDAATIDAIDARATALLARDVSLWIAVESPTPAAADLDAWAASVNALVTRLRHPAGVARDRVHERG